MNPFALSVANTIAVAVAATSVGFGAGIIFAGRHASRRDLAEYQAGANRGRADGERWAREEAEYALARFPTSIGGRAIVRALGGTVPPLPRVRRVEVTAAGTTFVHDPDGTGPSTSATALVMLDAGEGAE